MYAGDPSSRSREGTDAAQVHFHLIPKPNATEGLGIGWPVTATDMDALRQLQAALKAKM